MKSRKHIWLYLGIFFALISSLIAAVIWLYLPERFDLTKSLYPILVAAFVGAGIGARSSSRSADPSSATRTAYTDRAIAQSKTKPGLMRAPILWVAAFSVMGFTLIYSTT